MRLAALVAVALLAAPALVALAPAADASSHDGPVLHLDAASGFASDASGRGNDGALENMRGPTSGRAGEGTAASPFVVRFDGFDDLVTTKLKTQARGETTLAVWLRTHQPGGKIAGFETSQRGVSADHDRDLVMSDDGRVHLLASRATGGWANVSSPRPLADGAWHHVAAVVAPGALRLFVDGTLVDERALDSPPRALEGYWRMGHGAIRGAPAATSHQAFWGEIASLHVYDRALDAAQVDALARAGALADAPRAGAVALEDALSLLLDPADATQARVPDASPRGNDGLLRDRAAPTSGPVGNGSRAAPHALAFNGQDDLLRTSTRLRAPDAFSVSLWFRTSYSGAKLAGFETTQDGVSGDHDRLVYLTEDGRVAFGVWTPAGAATLRSAPGHVDGAWHHVVATKDVVQGTRLFVDGALADEGDTRASHPLAGYWRFGGGRVLPWPDAPRHTTLEGLLGEVRVYERPLAAAEVAALRARGPDGRGSVEPPAVDLLTGLRLHLDARDRTADGRVPDRSGHANDGILLGAPGANIGAGDAADPTALPFDGADDHLTTTVKLRAPDAFTLAMWVRADRGGAKLAGIETVREGLAGDHDRVLYLDGTGRPVFGVWVPREGPSRLAGATPISDGAWHHVVASKAAMGAGGAMRLYVDGALVAEGAATARHDLEGYWRFGGGSLSGWEPRAERALAGALASVRVYARELQGGEVAALHALGPQGEAASAPPPAQPGSTSPPASSTTTFTGSKRTAAPPGLFLSVAGSTTQVHDLQGCHPRATLLLDPPGPGGVRKKQVAAVGFEPCRLEVGVAAAGLHQWIQATLAGTAAPLEAVLTQRDAHGQVVRQVTLHGASLAEVRFPAIDGSSNASARLQLVVEPTTHALGASPSCCPAPAKTVQSWSANGGKVEEASLGGLMVSRFGPVAWTKTAAGAQVEVGPLTLSQKHGAAFGAWAMDFLVNGSNGDADEGTLTVDYLGKDLKTLLYRLTLEGVGVSGGDLFLPADPQDPLRRRTFSLYAESMSLA